MEKVVYILGAGFSAPLGLPVMSNFVQKSKDLYENNKDNFNNFPDVFEMFEKLNRVMKYYNTDLDNIEDLLSILEFRSRFSSSRRDDENYSQLIAYIKDVIEAYTPELNTDQPRIELKLFASNEWEKYVAFVGSIFNSSFTTKGFEGFDYAYLFTDRDIAKYRYDIITLNYDHILEKCENYLKRFGNKKYFSREIRASDDKHVVYLAKLHGDIEEGDIVPPTSSKGLHQNNGSDWQVAYKLLSEANHIRILGYSLPSTDTYIKYLLQSAITESKIPNLKSLDVLCIDQDGSVQKRYNDFVNNKKIFRFLPLSMESYLENHLSVCSPYGDVFLLNKLQETHEIFFTNHK